MSTLPPYVKKVCNNSAVILVNPTNLISVLPKCTNLELKMRDGRFSSIAFYRVKVLKIKYTLGSHKSILESNYILSLGILCPFHSQSNLKKDSKNLCEYRP